MWKLKACPHCGGDLFVTSEGETCLQCGYLKEYDRPKAIVAASLGQHKKEKA